MLKLNQQDSILGPHASQINCPLGLSACQSTCITNAKVCDGVAHCPNGTDEENCENWQCVEGMNKCADNKQCIYKHSFFDSKKDCHTGFRCQDGVCLPKHLHCDGHFDCKDSSDEINCPCESDPSLTTCPGSEQCIPKVWVCDGIVNCNSQSEEQECGGILLQPSTGKVTQHQKMSMKNCQ